MLVVVFLLQYIDLKEKKKRNDDKHASFIVLTDITIAKRQIAFSGPIEMFRNLQTKWRPWKTPGQTSFLQSTLDRKSLLKRRRIKPNVVHLKTSRHDKLTGAYLYYTEPTVWLYADDKRNSTNSL